MPANHGVTLAAQVLGQITLHLRGGGIGHRVEVLVKFWHQADTVTLGVERSFDSRLVICKAFFRRETRHPDIDAGLLRVTIRIGEPHLAELAHGFVQQHHVNVMMILRRTGSEFSERASLQAGSFLQRCPSAARR